MEGHCFWKKVTNDQTWAYYELNGRVLRVVHGRDPRFPLAVFGVLSVCDVGSSSRASESATSDYETNAPLKKPRPRY